MQPFISERFTLLYNKGDKQNKCIYLTFDDGPNPYVTLKILDVLDEFKVKATFFLIGQNIKKFPRIAKEIYSRGHILGNHSFSHSMFFVFCSPKAQKAQAQKVEDLLKDIGIKPCLYFRPPNAICSNTTLKVLSHYTIVGANHWISDNLIFSPSLIVSAALDSIRNRGGGILVLHDGICPLIYSTRNIIPKALSDLIPRLISEGYQFLSLDAVKDSNVVIPTNRALP